MGQPAGSYSRLAKIPRDRFPQRKGLMMMEGTAPETDSPP